MSTTISAQMTRVLRTVTIIDGVDGARANVETTITPSGADAMTAYSDTDVTTPAIVTAAAQLLAAVRAAVGAELPSPP